VKSPETEGRGLVTDSPARRDTPRVPATAGLLPQTITITGKGTIMYIYDAAIESPYPIAAAVAALLARVALAF
jgi:hypothetical protein